MKQPTVIACDTTLSRSSTDSTRFAIRLYFAAITIAPEWGPEKMAKVFPSRRAARSYAITVGLTKQARDRGEELLYIDPPAVPEPGTLETGERSSR